MFDGSYFFVNFTEFTFIFFNVKACDTAYGQCEQFVNIFVGDCTAGAVKERLQSVVNFTVFFFFAFTFFDTFVDTVFKEYLCESFCMKKFIEFIEFHLTFTH